MILQKTNDYFLKTSNFAMLVFRLCGDFFNKYNIEANTLFMSNDVHKQFLKLNFKQSDTVAQLIFDGTNRIKILGLDVKTLRSREDEIYVGLIE